MWTGSSISVLLVYQNLSFSYCLSTWKVLVPAVAPELLGSLLESHPPVSWLPCKELKDPRILNTKAKLQCREGWGFQGLVRWVGRKPVEFLPSCFHSGVCLRRFYFSESGFPREKKTTKLAIFTTQEISGQFFCQFWQVNQCEIYLHFLLANCRGTYVTFLLILLETTLKMQLRWEFPT